MPQNLNFQIGRLEGALLILHTTTPIDRSNLTELLEDVLAELKEIQSGAEGS